MAAVANNPAFAKKVGVPRSVGQEFNEADKGRKFSKGGDTMASKMNPGFMAMMKKKGTKKMADGGMPAALAKHAAKPAATAHAGLTAKKMAGGGYTVPPNGIMDSGGGAARYAKGGSTGSFRAAANGVATKGKTKGKQIVMKKGGMC
jgi:hypothetical protein